MNALGVKVKETFRQHQYPQTGAPTRISERHELVRRRANRAASVVAREAQRQRRQGRSDSRRNGGMRSAALPDKMSADFIAKTKKMATETARDKK